MRLVHAKDGIEQDTVVAIEHDITDDEAGFFGKTGGRNGGETLKCANHASIVGNRPATRRGC